MADSPDTVSPGHWFPACCPELAQNGAKIPSKRQSRLFCQLYRGTLLNAPRNPDLRSRNDHFESDSRPMDGALRGFLRAPIQDTGAVLFVWFHPASALPDSERPGRSRTAIRSHCSRVRGGKVSTTRVQCASCECDARRYLLGCRHPRHGERSARRWDAGRLAAE